MTPAQKRSLEILQKPVLELGRYIQQQLNTNPILEVDESYDTQKPETVGNVCNGKKTGEVRPKEFLIGKRYGTPRGIGACGNLHLGSRGVLVS